MCKKKDQNEKEEKKMRRIDKGIFQYGENGAFYIRYQYKNDRLQERTGAKNITEAREFLSARKTDIARGEYKLPTSRKERPYLIEEAARDYLDWSRTHKRSFLRDQTVLKKLLQHFGKKTQELGIRFL